MMISMIGLGGAMGAAARYSIGLVMKKFTIGSFPYGTWIVNIVGSLLLGAFANVYGSGELKTSTWSFIGIGFCGAFTTFSTFSYETLQLLQEKKYRTTIIYVLSSLVIGLLAAAVGWFLSSNF
ncbi:fluoride efflux transporter CrcB [Alkalihalobacillus sp. AL-G]|uniref:fluoride efflux transporter CrcB n=1 Tax=Alkalihalobacillus sp. AL-G TaxID=2926399 RepID=UPI00272A18FE|nr:fluoride efflux transporter CrcB [Alkalihalobacillus sp. AL-G]WLD92780.1 fluoride efflux transporter CrcB [Alkalihalobacillus sp. AL-G]